MQGNLKPYSLPIFGGSANQKPDTQITPNNYIASYIEGQKTTICVSILFILFPAFNWCQTSNADKHLKTKQITMLQSSLNCVNVWNWVMVITIILASINQIRLIIKLLLGEYEHAIGGVVVYAILFVYNIINIINYIAQIQSYKVAKQLVLSLGTGSISS